MVSRTRPAPALSLSEMKIRAGVDELLGIAGAPGINEPVWFDPTPENCALDDAADYDERAKEVNPDAGGW